MHVKNNIVYKVTKADESPAKYVRFMRHSLDVVAEPISTEAFTQNEEIVALKLFACLQSRTILTYPLCVDECGVPYNHCQCNNHKHSVYHPIHTLK